MNTPSWVDSFVGVRKIFIYVAAMVLFILNRKLNIGLDEKWMSAVTASFFAANGVEHLSNIGKPDSVTIAPLTALVPLTPADPDRTVVDKKL